MDSKEIQYALDRRGYVLIDEDSNITTPIQLGHLEGNVVIESRGNKKLWMEQGAQRAAFEYDYRSTNTNDPPCIRFENINTDSRTSWHSLFRVIQPNTAPETLESYDVFTECSGGFAYDCPASGPMRHIIFEDCSKNGASHIRWKFSEPRQIDFIDLLNVRCLGGGRVGPMFDFTYPTNLYGELLIDEGDPALDYSMKNVWFGPIAFRIINPCGYCYFDNYWLEPWGSPDDDYPGCHAIEVRVDDMTGEYGQFRFDLANYNDVLSYSDGVVKAWFMGGSDNDDSGSLVYRYMHNESYGSQPKPSLPWNIAGKTRAEVYEEVSGTIFETAWPDRLNGISPNSYIRFMYIPGSFWFPRYADDPEGVPFFTTNYATEPNYRSQATSPEYDA